MTLSFPTRRSSDLPPSPAHLGSPAWRRPQPCGPAPPRGRPLAPPTRRRRPSRRQLDVLVAAGADTEETDRHAHLGFEEGDVVLGPLGQVAGLGGLAEVAPPPGEGLVDGRSEEHTSELQSLMRTSY